jgi:hypothetical protein
VDIDLAFYNTLDCICLSVVNTARYGSWKAFVDINLKLIEEAYHTFHLLMSAFAGGPLAPRRLAHAWYLFCVSVETH